MNISEKLAGELETILSGDAWYGSPVYSIIEQVTFEPAL